MSNRTLPSWDLSDLYSGLDDAKLTQDMQNLQLSTAAFVGTYRDKLAGLSADELATALQQYEQLTETLVKIEEYASLSYDTNLTNEKVVAFFQNISEFATDLGSKTIFFELELCQLDETRVQEMYRESTALLHYKPFLQHVRLFRQHMLEEKQEQIFNDTSVSGSEAWRRLYDETLGELHFNFRGEDLNDSEIANKMLDEDPEVRREAGKVMGDVFHENRKIFAFIANTLAKDKEIDDRWHNYASPLARRNMGNMLDDKIVNCLADTVRNNYENICHRYYRLKAKMWGKETLHYTDRNAPLNFAPATSYSWDDTKQLVHQAYVDFSPKMAEIGQRFFDHNWIDVPPKKGKRGGAFACACVPSVHPYLMLNFQGKCDDVLTLAHELGHGIHQSLAAPQGLFMQDAILPFAETASIFGEQLAFDKLLSGEVSTSTKIDLLAKRIEEMIATVIRQISYHDFELHVHEGRKAGELGVEDLADFWMQEQERSLGNIFVYDEHYRYTWARVHHFIHYPFYVYAYAFAGCLVNSLYKLYREGNTPGFVDKYLKLLASGATLEPTEALVDFNLSIAKPDFWQKGLDLIGEWINELENLWESAGKPTRN